MPTYEYECQKCGKREELHQKLDERIPPVCCGDKMMTLIGKTSFVLNGNGWSRDGYSKGGS